MNYILSALLVLVPTLSDGYDVKKCERKYDDGQVRDLIKDKVSYPGGYEADVNWKKCKYYIVVYPIPITPDTQKIIVLDSNGNVIDGPR